LANVNDNNKEKNAIRVFVSMILLDIRDRNRGSYEYKRHRRVFLFYHPSNSLEIREKHLERGERETLQNKLRKMYPQNKTYRF